MRILQLHIMLYPKAVTKLFYVTLRRYLYYVQNKENNTNTKEKNLIFTAFLKFYIAPKEALLL